MCLALISVIGGNVLCMNELILEEFAFKTTNPRCVRIRGVPELAIVARFYHTDVRTLADPLFVVEHSSDRLEDI